MKRIQEKVKDIVEVRQYESLHDFMADPGRTLANYHFTDATSELMAKWLDRIAQVRTGSGGAYALAGYRGVGKSHFLASLTAVASRPELRSRIADPHVTASVERLTRRHYPAAYVRRGTGATLVDELRSALENTASGVPGSSSASIREMLEKAAEKAGDLPFLLIVDTAFERGARVARDDGPFLVEMAEAAKRLNIFLGVILDDDIAGADGTNSGIAGTYTIDYLDQEHLYKVVNSNVFPKHSQKQAVLQEIYTYFREVLPDFRWSEQRFASLYPLHPAILEVAPFVRLYVHDFALLGFAAAAAERIMGRPANSLIALDEVFDSTEKGLRKIEDLKEAFDAYDRLNNDVVAKIPVMQRLQAKLILKALLLLSLDGQGATPGQIAASMLIFDENEPQRAAKSVEDLVRTFAETLPNDIRVASEGGRSARYAFTVRSKDGLNQALSERAAALPHDVLALIQRKFIKDRFADCSFSNGPENTPESMDCAIVWRGTSRPGRIVWAANGPLTVEGVQDTFGDWEVSITTGSAVLPDANGPAASIHWRPDDVRVEELETLFRHYVLSTDAALREEFTEEVRASLHSHSVAAERIMNRIFLEDGKLVMDGFDYNFTEEARVAPTLSGLFSLMLEPLFETRFPSHPVFPAVLGTPEVEALSSGLFSVSRQNLPEVQKLAAAFAVPLGLVRDDGGTLVPQTDEALSQLPLVSEVLKLVEEAGDSAVELQNVYGALRRLPFGIAKEAQHIILAALVASRRIEFVTATGNRINRRSLDLRIMWDDIVGITRPAEAAYSTEKLLKWAAVFTEKAPRSLESDEERMVVESGLSKWLDEWQDARVLERFDTIRDERLNTRIWKLAAQCVKTLGTIKENIALLVSGSVSLEECLNRIADTFDDSFPAFEEALSRLAVVDSFIEGEASRREILSYVSACEYTGNEEIEDTREQLLRAVDASYFNPSEASNRELGYLWIKFQRDFSEHFAERHDAVMRAPGARAALEKALQSEEWWQFENLSQISVFDQTHWHAATAIRRAAAAGACTEQHGDIMLRPFCTCPFTLAENVNIDPGEHFSKVVFSGLEAYRHTLAERGAEVAVRLTEFAGKSDDPEARKTASSLAETLKKDSPASNFNSLELHILRSALAEPGSSEERDLKAETIPPPGPQKEAREPVDDVLLINV